MTEAPQPPGLPESASFVLKDIRINGSPPPGRSEQSLVLIIKQKRKPPLGGKSWSQNDAYDLEYITVLIIEKGATELVGMDSS